MFTPTIDLEVLYRATTLRFTDTTGADSGDGTGWDGVSGIDSADVSAATLVITDPNGDETEEDILAIIAAASPVTDDIVFDDISGEWVDGYYTVVYNIWMADTAITAFTDYSGTVAGAVLVTSAGHGVTTGMKVTIAGSTNYNGTHDAVRVDANSYYILDSWAGDDAAGTSTPLYSNSFTPFVFANAEMAVDKMYAVYAEMAEGTEADNYRKMADDANGMLNALKSAIATASTAVINNIYGRILRILDFYGIDLIYS